MSSQITTTNKPTSNVLQAGSLPVAKQTVSKHWMENITFHGLAHYWRLFNFV